MVFQASMMEYQWGNGSWFVCSLTIILLHSFPRIMALLYPSLFDISANYIDFLCVWKWKRNPQFNSPFAIHAHNLLLLLFDITALSNPNRFLFELSIKTYWFRCTVIYIHYIISARLWSRYSKSEYLRFIPSSTEMIH